MKIIKKTLLIVLMSEILLGNPMSNNQEELIIKDEKIVMFRDSSVKKDYFFYIDKIAFIEKDSTKIGTRYNIVLLNGKTINIYKKENYKELMSVFLNMQKKKIQTSPVPKTKQNNSLKEEEIIEDINIKNMEKIIALDPLDIKEAQ